MIKIRAPFYPFMLYYMSTITSDKNARETRVGIYSEPVGELTKLGWVVVSLGNSSGVSNLLFSKISFHDYENMCSLDCLSKEENHVNRMISCMVLVCETNLIRKASHSLLSENKYESIRSFINSVKNLRRADKLEVGDNITHEQRANEIIEKVEVEEVNERVKELFAA